MFATLLYKKRYFCSVGRKNNLPYLFIVFHKESIEENEEKCYTKGMDLSSKPAEELTLRAVRIVNKKPRKKIEKLAGIKSEEWKIMIRNLRQLFHTKIGVVANEIIGNTDHPLHAAYTYVQTNNYLDPVQIDTIARAKKLSKSKDPEGMTGQVFDDEA